MEFTTYQEGKTSCATFDSVKKYIFGNMKKHWDYDDDIAEYLDTGVEDYGKEPTRTVTAKTTMIKNEEGTESSVPVSKEEQDMLQSGYGIMYHEEVHLHLDRKMQFMKNKKKACEYIISHCNTVMRARIEEIPNYKERVKNDPLVILDEINQKMYDPQQCKYNCETLYNVFDCIFGTKQGEKSHY